MDTGGPPLLVHGFLIGTCRLMHPRSERLQKNISGTFWSFPRESSRSAGAQTIDRRAGSLTGITNQEVFSEGRVRGA
jgi:hypothetical protein